MLNLSRFWFAATPFCLIVAACSSSSIPGPGTGDGTITGTVSSSAGGGLAGVTVQVTPGTGGALPPVTTNSSGVYTVTNVPDGGGAIAVSNLPTTCTAPTTDGYVGVTTGGTLTVNLVANCTATNSLVVVITGAAGVTPSATVAGPGGYAKTVTATTTLTGLASGTYTVTTASGTTTETSPIVNTIYTGSVVGSPANVSSTTVDTVLVTYSAEGTGALWFSDLYGAPAAQLASSGTITPADSCNGADGNAAFAFDANGNLWTLNGTTGENELVEFTAAQLANECDVASPTVSIGGLVNTSVIVAMAFDAHGTLWFMASSSTGAGSNVPYLFGYTAAQLKSSGNQAPAILIQPNGVQNMPGVLSFPQWIAFDASGDLWVADNAQMLEYTPSQLAASGSPTPAVLATSGTATDGPTFLGFDAGGDLWVLNTNTGSGSVLSEFSKASLSNLASNASPAAIFGTELPQTGFNAQAYDWVSFAFDNSGNLWMLTEGGPSDIAEVQRFPAANIQVGGSGQSDIAVVSNVPGNFGLTIAFNPTPTGLPLVGSRVVRRPTLSLAQRHR